MMFSLLRQYAKHHLVKTLVFIRNFKGHKKIIETHIKIEYSLHYMIAIELFPMFALWKAL